MTKTLEDLQPASEAEKYEAARAVNAFRKREEDTALVNSLTLRERCLVEHAWHEGAEAARKEISSKLASPHAVTLDAQSVGQVLDKWFNSPDVAQLPQWHEGLEASYDSRVVILVRRALQHEAALQGGQDG